MTFRPGRKVVVIEPETVMSTIQRLEALTERIEATAAVLEQLIAKLRAEESEARKNDQ
jgi:hypothetical protein